MKGSITLGSLFIYFQKILLLKKKSTYILRNRRKHYFESLRGKKKINRSILGTHTYHSVF